MLEVARRLEAALAVIERRPQVAGERAGAAIALEAPRAPRPRAHTGLAPTEAAGSMTWRGPRNRRWQFAIGAIALIASATMLLFTRGGEPQAARAAEANALVGGRAVREATPSRAVEAVAAAPVEPTVLRAGANAELVEVVPAVGPTALPRPTRAGSPSRASAPARRAAPRNAPAVPRRGDARIDPDGTIDPYR